MRAYAIICSEFDGLLLDYSRQQATLETIEKLFKLAEVVFPFLFYSQSERWEGHGIMCFFNHFLAKMQAANLKQKIDLMFSGEHVSSGLS